MTHTITRSFQDTTKATTSKAEAISANVEHSLDQAVPVAANNHYVFAVSRAAMQLVEIYADAAVTIYVNAASGGSPSDTIVLAAGQVIVWTLGTDTLTAGPGRVTCPFSVDVTGLYITNAGAAVANVKVRVLANQ